MLYKLRLIYHTAMQYLPIVAVWWALFISGAGIGWWIASAVVIFVLNVYGFGIAFHHTFSHRTFTFNRPIEIALMYIGTCATLVAPLTWAVTHMAHHRYVDTEDDPHAPSTLGWKILFFINHVPKKYSALSCRHLIKDKAHLWFDSHIGYWTTVLSFPLLCFLVGGLYGLVFLWAIPTFYLLLTGMIFALAHYGETNEFGHKARDSWVLSLFSFGDGNHLKHHSEWNYTGWFHRKCALLIGREYQRK